MQSPLPLSLLMENSKSTIKSSLEKTLSRMDTGLQNSYLQYVDSWNHKDRTLNFQEYMIYHYLLLTGFIHATIYYNGASVLVFGGTELLKEESKIQSKYSLGKIELGFQENDKSILLKGYVPLEIESVSKKISELDIIPFCKNLYFFKPELNDERKLDVYTPLEKNIHNLISRDLENYPSICFSHFRFQSLHVFFEFLGMQNSIEITEIIVKQLEKYFKNCDAIFQLSPGSYLVISSGITGKKIVNRFQGIFFQARSIILDYTLKTSDINSIPESYSDLWKELEI
ncbi:MAG: hypothetical protein OEZ34_04740 [Spirochaetia bacterium]|nr:hypothetical protein [Spirochaetia bacterium]